MEQLSASSFCFLVLTTALSYGMAFTAVAVHIGVLTFRRLNGVGVRKARQRDTHVASERASKPLIVAYCSMMRATVPGQSF